MARKILIVPNVLFAVLLLVACGSSGGAPAKPSASGLPAAGDVAKNGTTVSAGDWGVVTGSTTDATNVFAVRITSVAVGTAGGLSALAPSAAEGDRAILRDDTPYYVSVDVSTLAGSLKGEAKASLFGASSSGNATGFDTVDAPSNLQRCTTPDDGTAPDAFGLVRHRCVVVAGTSRPATLVFTNSKGSQNVRFALPSS